MFAWLFVLPTVLALRRRFSLWVSALLAGLTGGFILLAYTYYYGELSNASLGDLVHDYLVWQSAVCALYALAVVRYWPAAPANLASKTARAGWLLGTLVISAWLAVGMLAIRSEPPALSSSSAFIATGMFWFLLSPVWLPALIPAGWPRLANIVSKAAGGVLLLLSSILFVCAIQWSERGPSIWLTAAALAAVGYMNLTLRSTEQGPRSPAATT
jgi:hypothetical protein